MHYKQFDLRCSVEDKKNFIVDFILRADSKLIHCDILDCTKSFSRQATDKTVDEILNMLLSVSLVGIKVCDKGLSNFYEYEQWEDGYVEMLVRTMTTPDYFIWAYARKEYAELLIETVKRLNNEN